MYKKQPHSILGFRLGLGDKLVQVALGIVEVLQVDRLIVVLAFYDQVLEAFAFREDITAKGLDAVDGGVAARAQDALPLDVRDLAEPLGYYALESLPLVE